MIISAYKFESKRPHVCEGIVRKIDQVIVSLLLIKELTSSWIHYDLKNIFNLLFIKKDRTL